MSQNLLIRAPNHLGDCLMALPMIGEAREAYPGATVSVLAPEHLVPLFEHNPAIDRVVAIPSEYVHGLKAVFKIKEIIEQGKYSTGYILPPSFGAASGFKLAGVPERIGYIADKRRLLLTRPLTLPEPLNSEHRSVVYFNLLRRGASCELVYTNPQLFLIEDDYTRAADLLAGFGVGGNDSYAVIAFRAVAESRRWGIENYTDLAERFLDEFNCKVILIGSTDDRPDGDTIVDVLNSDGVVNLAGKTSIREAAAICSRSRVFVGNDSGPAHLAAAVGAPIVVLSGADDPPETSPMSESKRLIRADALDCLSCRKNICPLKGEPFMRCMREISLERVLAEINDLLDPGISSS